MSMSQDKTLLCFRPTNLNCVWKRDELQRPVAGFWYTSAKLLCAELTDVFPSSRVRGYGWQSPQCFRKDEKINTGNWGIKCVSCKHICPWDLNYSCQHEDRKKSLIYFYLLLTSQYVTKSRNFSNDTLHIFRKLSFNKHQSSSNNLQLLVLFMTWCGDYSCRSFGLLCPLQFTLRTCALKRQKMMGRVCEYTSEVV